MAPRTTWIAIALCGLVASSAACKSEVDNAPAAEVIEPTPAPAAAVEPEIVDQQAAAAPAVLAVSPTASKIEFIGAKVTGDHTGSFKTFDGKMHLGADGSLEKVSFDVDVASMVTDDERLTGHLKGSDFFDVAKFPKASFVSTSITPGVTSTDERIKERGYTHTVTGEMTMHGVTKTISFPAKVEMSPTGVEAESEFTLKRFDFGIVYPGKAEDLIKDEVLVRLDLEAPRPA